MKKTDLETADLKELLSVLKKTMTELAKVEEAISDRFGVSLRMSDHKQKGWYSANTFYVSRGIEMIEEIAAEQAAVKAGWDRRFVKYLKYNGVEYRQIADEVTNTFTTAGK